MSSNLFPYKYSFEEWYKADYINESDVVVIVDTSRETIWFYSGKKSTARNRSKARELLNDLMKNYSSYSLKIVSEMTPDDILVKLEDLKEEFFKRKISNLRYDIRKVSDAFFYIICIAGALLIISSTFSIFLLFGNKTSLFSGYTHFTISLPNFSFQMLFISSLLLGTFICFTIAFLIVFFLMKKTLIFYTVLALVLSFLGYFIVRIWDVLLIYEIIGQSILFRIDVFSMFIINFNLIGTISLSLAFVSIIIGPKRIMAY